jgi:hypothetical protein
VVPKISTSGASIRSALAYDQASKNGEPPGEWVAGTLIGTPREMAKHTAMYRQLRPDCKKAIWSCSLSLPPSDGRREAAEWGQIAEAFLQKMGVDRKTHAWAAHRHTHHNDHIHIRLCRISSSGTLWNQEHSAKRAIAACSELEDEFHLVTHDRTPAKKKRLTMAEEQIFNRKGIPMSRTTIQSAVDSIIADHPQGIEFAELQALLAARQIDIQAYAPGGVLKGVSYLHDSVKWPGSKIGSDYSAGLTSRGVRYGAEAPRQDTPPAEQKKTIPPAQRAAEQVTYSVPAKTWTFDGKNAIESGSMSSPFSMVAAAVMELAAKLIALGIKMWRAILEWLGRKLGIAGLGMTSNEAARSVQIAPQSTVIDVPSRVVPDPQLLSQTAAEINAVGDAVENNNSSLLPESAQDLAEYFNTHDSAEQVEADPFDFVSPLHGDQEHEQATPTPLSLFLAAKTAHAAAQIALKKTMDSDEGGGVGDIWGGREIRDQKVQELRAATAKLTAIKSEGKAWEDHSFVNKMAGKIGGNPHDASEAQAQTKVAKLAAELKALHTPRSVVNRGCPSQ